jgi:DNA-binding NarL/FixJ family response regulator
MNTQKESIAPHAPAVETPAASAVIAEFLLDKIPCLVMVEDIEPAIASGSDIDADCRRLGSLDLGGQRYAVYARDTPAPPPAAEVDPLSSLTAREQQIVRLVCLGCVNKQIAHRLRISEYTVKTYLKQIFCKLNVHSRSAMVFRCASWAHVDILQNEGHG